MDAGLLSAFAAGLALGLSLILAIGAQNAFVLRQGLRGDHVFAVVMTCALSDALLITAGVSGFAALAEAAPWIAPLLRWGGAAFLLVYGAKAALAAWRGGEALKAADEGAAGLRRAVLTCLALTWLNPHVYLDTLVLLGSIASRFEGRVWAFGSGAVMASFLFFFGLGYGARLLRPVFARPAAWRVLDAVIALVMWSIAAGLVWGG